MANVSAADVEKQQNSEHAYLFIRKVSDENGIKVADEAKAFKAVGEVLEQGKDKKIIVFKYKAKKNERKKQGHRQPYTKITIESIG